MAMLKKVATVDITKIDTETVEVDPSFFGAYAFYIKLSARPDPRWVRIFNFEWERSKYLMKREIRVVADRLRLISGADDNIQKHVDFAKMLVKKTNQRIEEDNRRIELAEQRRRGGGKWVEKEREEIRKKLRGISSE